MNKFSNLIEQSLGRRHVDDHIVVRISQHLLDAVVRDECLTG